MRINLANIYKLLIICILCSCSQISCSSPETAGEALAPPKGYRNNTTLKIAYTTGTLKLIDDSPPVPETMMVHKDLVYKETSEKNLKLDIYHLRSINTPTPLLVFIHGGAWKKGNKDDYRRYLVDYAEKGYITATVAYRFAQEAPFPAALDDVVCAIKWLKQNATEYHIDPERVAVIGGSAGGHLAMLLGYHANDENYEPECAIASDARVKAVVNFYGPSDLTTDFAVHHSSVINFIGKEYSEATRGAYVAGSPLFFVTPDDPPTIIFHGTIDDVVPVEQSDKLKEKLEEHRVPNYYYRLEGWPHTMDLGLKVNQYCQYHMDEFFRKHLD